jgi:hypothetical protein
VLINREIKTALVIDIEVLGPTAFSTLKQRKLQKYEYLSQGIKNNWKLNSVFKSS